MTSTGPKIHAFVMAGGSGSRLHPLTTGLCKPALSFGGDHRVVDFVLANLRNSDIEGVDLLVQYQPDRLVEHVRRRWSGDPGFPVRVAAPQAQRDTKLAPCGYRGTADAVAQNLDRLDASGADVVAVFGADHVYRMDVRQMVDFHLAHGADATIAALPVPLHEASSFGIIAVDDSGQAIRFEEKPKHATPMPGRSDHALGSMGNYLFSARVLREVLAETQAAGEFDFGHHVLPRLLGKSRVMVYDFQNNVVPGTAPHEQAGYWRDVGTLGAFFTAHMDTLGSAPRFALDNRHWPLAPRLPGQPPALVVRGRTSRSRLGPGAMVDTATLDEVVLGSGVRVAPGALLERCVVFDGVTIGAGARLRQVIIDEGNHVPPHEVIGYDPERDRERFPVTEDGIVIVPRGTFGGFGSPERFGREVAAAGERATALG